MKTKRILGFVALPLLGIAGLLIPQGLSGQTESGAAGVASLGGGPVPQVSMPAPPITGMGAYGGAGAEYGGGYSQMPPLVSQPSMSAYGGGFSEYASSSPVMDLNMTGASSNRLFGPQINFDTNFGEGLGYTEEYYRMNAMVPWHIVPGQTVMMFDAAAAVNDDGRGTFGGGLIYRNFDAARNRIFGWNAYYDLDQAVQDDDGYHRIGIGMESLGQWIDFRANGYYVLGDDYSVLSDQLVDSCSFIGHNIINTREREIETAFSGVDVEVGGPVPFLGHYGINGYVGGYYLDNDIAGDTTGVSVRVETLINDMTTANFMYTNDDLLGDNAFATLSISLPRWRTRGWFKPRVMQERLGERVQRSNRIHTDIATFRNREAAINPLDGQPYELLYVNPNLVTNGDGSVENPFSSVDALIAANGANYDILSIAPRGDNTSTNLVATGGLDLFAGQQLLGRTKTHQIFESDGVICELPSLIDDSNFLPGITDPLDRAAILPPALQGSGPGGFVVSLSDNNLVSGLRFDGNGGRGIVANRVNDFEITWNEFTNHSTAIDLTNVRGYGVITENTVNGADENGDQSSASGIVVSVPADEQLRLLLEGNTVTGHTGNGIDILARPGASIQANDPSGFRTGERTGILDNIADNNGRGIRLEARADARIQASVEENQFNNNDEDGFLAISDAGLVAFRSFARNTGNDNGGNGAFFHYLNGGDFFVLTEDLNEDGIFQAGEDLNGNGVFDQGFVQNNLSGNGLNGLCIFGQGSGEGLFDIGGPDPSLGNTFIDNSQAGIAMDLTGTARGQIDAMFNLISSSGTDSPFVSADQGGLTIVLDFLNPEQTPLTDPFGVNLTGFDIGEFGFTPADQQALETAVLAEVIRDFRGIVTSDIDPRSPIPEGMELAIDFVIGDLGDGPSNGSSEFYTHLISSETNAPALGVGFLGIVRDANGGGPNFGAVNGDVVSSTYSSQFPGIPGLNPPDALTSGNLEFTTFALAGTISHEVGHNLSLNLSLIHI